MEDNQNGRRPKWKTTKIEEDRNGRRKWKTTKNNLIGGPPKLKMTLMEDNQNRRRPKQKTKKMEDKENGRRPKWNTPKMEDDLYGNLILIILMIKFHTTKLN